MAEFLSETTYSNTSDLQKAQNAQAALDEIQTERFYNTLRSYYSYRNNDQSFQNKNAADLLEYFYEDRSWRNNNTISMGFDLASVANETNPERIKEFSYIQQTYSSLPSFWDDPNRSFGGWLIDNGGAMVADPVNLIGVGVGGQAAKQSFKLGLKELLKGKMAQEINKAAIEEMAKQATKASIGQAVKKGALYEGYFGAITNGAQDMLLQNTAIKAGIQDELDLKQTGLSTAAGFGLGTVFGGTFSAGAFKLTFKCISQLSSVKVVTSSRSKTDALLIKADKGPKVSTAREIRLPASPASPRLACSVSAFPPLSVIIWASSLAASPELL